MIRILLVDDQTLIRQGIQTLLELEPDLSVVGMAGDGRHALELAEQLHPDVVLMDIRMPEMDGISATRALLARNSAQAVIILTTFDDGEYVLEGLKAGARGYLLKDINSDEMIAAVRAAAANQMLIQPYLTSKIMAELSKLSQQHTEQAHMSEAVASLQLTERELDVLRAMARGLSNREIGLQLNITEGTVKNHVSNLLGKLNVRDRTQAILKAQEMKLL